MVESTHNDPSRKWLIFFFVCFTLTVFAIGMWAALMYHVDDNTAPASGGEHHGMILPGQIPHGQNVRMG